MCQPVTCSTCGRMVARKDAVSAVLMEAVDGNKLNLISSNLRNTGEIVYQCHLCVQIEVLESPPIFIRNERFKQGYDVGMEEAKKGYYTLTSGCLSDEEVVSCFKGLFAEYATEGSEEVLYYSIGTTVGLLIGTATMPCVDAYAVTRIDQNQASV